jgi:hypothetical protein
MRYPRRFLLNTLSRTGAGPSGSLQQITGNRNVNLDLKRRGDSVKIQVGTLSGLPNSISSMIPAPALMKGLWQNGPVVNGWFEAVQLTRGVMVRLYSIIPFSQLISPFIDVAFNRDARNYVSLVFAKNMLCCRTLGVQPCLRRQHARAAEVYWPD